MLTTEQYWGKGYATELGNKASHNALLKIGLHYVEGFYFEQE